MKGTAYFVKKPSKLRDLMRPHRIEDEVPYIVAKAILIPQIDYENIAADLTVDREYRLGTWDLELVSFNYRFNSSVIIGSVMPRHLGRWKGPLKVLPLVEGMVGLPSRRR